MACLNHWIPAYAGMTGWWIPRPLFQTRLYHPALAGAPPEDAYRTQAVEPRLGGYGHPALSPHTGHPVHKQAAEGNWNYFGDLCQTPLYCGSAELAERPASMQACPLNDGGGVIPAPSPFQPCRHSGEGRNPRLQDAGGRAVSGTRGRGNWNHLGRLFQTPLYRLRPVGVPSRRIQDILSINKRPMNPGGPTGG